MNTATETLQPQLEKRAILGALRALKRGDFSVQLPSDLEGTDGDIAEAFNEVVALNRSLTTEMSRVRRAVGRDGRIGERAKLDNASGAWRECVESVNELITDTVQHTSEISRVVGAVAKGDLAQTMALEADGRPLKGEFLHIAKTINTMVDRLSLVSSEVTRVAREVGTEGKLGGQARVRGVAGTWKDLTDNVNAMASNLTSQVRNIADVTTAVARGDLSKKITVDVKGEIQELKGTINTMVDQLNSFASEVTRVAGEVGTEGKLGGQAKVEGVAGTWKDLTDNVNGMASNLTSQVRNIAEVTTAVARGDLSKKITVDVKGEILELKDTINTMVDQLSSFASEVTRVAREVGTEGKLGGEARVEGVAGTWKDLTDNVNAMASNLTSQVRNIADVTTAVARGDLSKKITVDVKGEILELKNTINTMVDQLNSFASEVTRVAREVGTEGKLGGEAKVEGVAGTWKDLTDNVNAMASNLTGQVRNIADVTTAVARGDLSKKITVDVRGEILELKNTINTMVDQLNSFASEVTRVAREVGTEGKLGGEAQVRGVAGTWKDLTDNVNAMAGNLTSQVRNIADVTTAVARGDLSKKITVDVKGEILELKNTINTMVDQLNSFASEVTRVAREVGTEGKLGGQAQVQGVAGTWKDLTDNVNMMATNLTNQVRGIAEVVSGVATGNLKRKLTLDAKGEIAELAETINGMIETLAIFADQVTDVAREVGIEGKLGGQAEVPGAAGLWRDLTDNVNQLAANLTTQVRAIAEVATAVAEGDLTRNIAVAASGEVAALKDNINQMIANLRETTHYNMEQDWLKTNLARFTRMMQGERDLVTVCNLVLSEVAPLVEAQHGVFYVAREDDEVLDLTASYAWTERQHLIGSVQLRQGLIGQCAVEKRRILLTDVPPDYIRISSGLGEAAPLNIVVLPVLFEGSIRAVIELASFSRFSETQLSFLDQLVESIGIVLNTIAAGMRTETLLTQSQILTTELQSQQSELKTTNDRLEQQAAELRASEELLKTQQEELRAKNEELEEKAAQLENEKRQVEAINREVETARAALEEKAEQLALTSRYKSEFLANMSHELRTPLNSLLILSRLMAENAAGNLDPKQVEHARTIYAAGSDLLRLINDILDLSKIESGTVNLEISAYPLEIFREQTERTFRQTALEKGLEFSIELAEDLPPTIGTDPMRLQQVVNNLLSNAFKFTDQGSVSLRVHLAETTSPSAVASRAVPEQVIAFTITDTGIGISPEHQQVIFEAFQQADGTTSRRYGGTGLGLSISRELAALLGGEIRLHSRPGKGSTFTLYLPLDLERARLSESRRPRTGSNIERQEAMPAIELIRPDSEPDSIDTGPLYHRDRPQPFLLIVEDDPIFAGIVLDIAQEQGFDGLIVDKGRAVLAAVSRHRPDAICVDVLLSDMDGWTLVDLLTHHSSTRHLPIHVISGEEDKARLRHQSGAVYHSIKPVEREDLVAVFSRLREVTARDTRRLLVVNAGSDFPADLASLGEVDGVEIVEATPRQAGRVMRAEPFDCVLVTSAKLSQSMLKLVERLVKTKSAMHTRFIVRVAEPADDVRLSLPENVRLIAGDHAPGHCLDEVTRALNLPFAGLPVTVRSAIKRFRRQEPLLNGRKVAIIDDDVRNIFSLTAVLEQHQAQVLHAENGRDGIELVKANPDLHAVLVDIMMPELDGYEVMRTIRSMKQFEHLPLIAVTAKAMKEDRDRCFEAGASDYLAKPVEIDELISTLRTCVPYAQ